MKTTIKMLCLLAFLGFTTASKAQTKEETVQWLTEKMKKENFFQENHYTGTTPAKIHQVRFDDNFLLIDGEYTRSYKEYGIDYEIKEFFKYKINLSKLSDEVYSYRNYIATNGNYIEENSDWKKYKYRANDGWYLIDSKSSKEYTNYMRSVQINENVEPEILERFAKALKHYKSIMTVKKTNETF